MKRTNNRGPREEKSTDGFDSKFPVVEVIAIDAQRVERVKAGKVSREIFQRGEPLDESRQCATVVLVDKS